LVIVRDVGDDDRGLVRELRCAVFEGLLVLANEDHIGALVEVPKSESLSNTRRCTSDHDTLVHEIVYVLGLLHRLFLECIRNVTGESTALLLLLHLLLLHWWWLLLLHVAAASAGLATAHVVLGSTTTSVRVIAILLRRPTGSTKGATWRSSSCWTLSSAAHWHAASSRTGARTVVVVLVAIWKLIHIFSSS